MLQPVPFANAMAAASAIFVIVLLLLRLVAPSCLRWSEQTAVRIEEEVDLKADRLRITRSLYKRVPQVPRPGNPFVGWS